MPRRASLAVSALAVLVAVLPVALPAASAESDPSSFADDLVSMINDARAQDGLGTLSVTSGTTTIAIAWSHHLDDQQALSHRPDLASQLESHGSPYWTAYGENVGRGPTSSAKTLFDAYMNSPEHRDNILNGRFRYLGIGVVFDGDTAWNTLDFVDEYTTSTRPHAAPPAQPATVALPATSGTVRRAAPRRPTVTSRTPVRVRAARARTAHPVRVQAVQAQAPARPYQPDLAESAPGAALVGLAAAPALPAPIDLPAPSRSPVPYAVALLVFVAAARQFVLRGLTARTATAGT